MRAKVYAALQITESRHRNPLRVCCVKNHTSRSIKIVPCPLRGQNIHLRASAFSQTTRCIYPQIQPELWPTKCSPVSKHTLRGPFRSYSSYSALFRETQCCSSSGRHSDDACTDWAEHTRQNVPRSIEQQNNRGMPRTCSNQCRSLSSTHPDLRISACPPPDKITRY